MLREGRIPLSRAEHAAVEKLRTAHGERVTVTRRDPGETGPVLVHAAEKSFQVSSAGRTKAVN